MSHYIDRVVRKNYNDLSLQDIKIVETLEKIFPKVRYKTLVRDVILNGICDQFVKEVRLARSTEESTNWTSNEQQTRPPSVRFSSVVTESLNSLPRTSVKILYITVV